MSLQPRQTSRRTIRYSIATLAVMSIAVGVAAAAANPGQVDASFANSAQVDLSTRVHMRITNNTGEELLLTKKEHGGVGVHWQVQPVNLQPSQVETIDVYASSDPSIDITYVGASSGRMFELHGKTPSGSSNEASGKSYDPNYQVAVDSPEGGYNPTFVYNMQWGPTLKYTGSAQNIQIPAGVHRLAVKAVGGSGGLPWVPDADTGGDFKRATGAQLNGTLDVTPGEVLTVSVGGNGGDGKTVTDGHGGWGTLDYGGGVGANAGLAKPAGGGGATVIQRADGTVVAVAGGGGGGWGSNAQYKWTPLPHPVYASGGGAGSDGSSPRWGHSGESVDDNYPVGGKSGGWRVFDKEDNLTPHGGDATADFGGAGGGGAVGGAAGPANLTGGGAGSSSYGQLSSTSSSSGPDTGRVELSFAG